MKNTHLFLVLLSLTAASSCRKLSTPEPPGGTPVSNQMSGIVQGEPWVATSITAQQAGTALSIIGRSSDGKTITLYITETRTGGFLLSSGTPEFGTYADDSTKKSYKTRSPGGSGRITITGLDANTKTISGKFSFTGIDGAGDSIMVTEGQLTRVSYTPTTTGGGDKTLAARIDGNNWNASQVFAISSSGKISIAGFRTDNTSLGVLIPDDITTGVYSFSTSGNYTAQYNKDQSTILGATSGVLTITEHNTTTKTIRGTFNFEAEVPGNPSIHSTVTDGDFSAVYE